ncbi:hypothetical protein DFJ73DRAFT_32676 [Zopfochytrium polystomum]|nr:hypothetical protein DFJ73DRAFT_32676 [Zopfochytrium polystomum]
MQRTLLSPFPFRQPIHNDSKEILSSTASPTKQRPAQQCDLFQILSEKRRLQSTLYTKLPAQLEKKCGGEGTSKFLEELRLLCEATGGADTGNVKEESVTNPTVTHNESENSSNCEETCGLRLSSKQEVQCFSAVVPEVDCILPPPREVRTLRRPASIDCGISYSNETGILDLFKEMDLDDLAMSTTTSDSFERNDNLSDMEVVDQNAVLEEANGIGERETPRGQYFSRRSGKLGSLETRAPPENRPYFRTPFRDENGHIVDFLETPVFQQQNTTATKSNDDSTRVKHDFSSALATASDFGSFFNFSDGRSGSMPWVAGQKSSSKDEFVGFDRLLDEMDDPFRTAGDDKGLTSRANEPCKGAWIDPDDEIFDKDGAFFSPSNPGSSLGDFSMLSDLETVPNEQILEQANPNQFATPRSTAKDGLLTPISKYFLQRSRKIGALGRRAAPENRVYFSTPKRDRNGRIMDSLETPVKGRKVPAVISKARRPAGPQSRRIHELRAHHEPEWPEWSAASRPLTGLQRQLRNEGRERQAKVGANSSQSSGKRTKLEIPTSRLRTVKETNPGITSKKDKSKTIKSAPHTSQAHPEVFKKPGQASSTIVPINNTIFIPIASSSNICFRNTEAKTTRFIVKEERSHHATLTAAITRNHMVYQFSLAKGALIPFGQCTTWLTPSKQHIVGTSQQTFKLCVGGAGASTILRIVTN